MTRRTLHNRIATGLTIFSIAVALGCFFLERSIPAFLIVCGVYFGLLLIYSVFCRLHVPRHLRLRPEVPTVFNVFRIGCPNEAIVAALAGASIQKETLLGKVRHRLHFLEESFPQGVWRRYVETEGGQIVAHVIHFISAESPVLDKGKQYGTGWYLDAEYPPWIVDK